MLDRLFGLFEGNVKQLTLAPLQLQIGIACDIDKILKSRYATNPQSEIQDKSNLEKEIMALMKVVDKSKTAKMNLWEKYHTKVIAADTFKAESERIDAQLKNYKNQLAQLHEELVSANSIPKDNDDNAFVQQFSKHAGLQELTRYVVVSLIEEVRFYSAKNIEAHFNFADEYGKIKESVLSTAK